MAFIRSIITAFAMFSCLPVPKIEWNGRSMRYLMPAFPFVGIAVGIAVLAWNAIAVHFGLGAFLRGAGFAALPALVTGCIHLDGFCDTVDALSSRACRDKKLQILEDPHIGAFAAIGCGLYFLVYAAFASELDGTANMILCFSLTFVVSRSLRGLAVVFLPCAKNSGLAKTFADESYKKISGVILFAIFICTCVLMAYLDRICGISAIIGALIAFIAYRKIAIREFGGITGDTAGWFLQICEITSLVFFVSAQKLFLYIA